MAVITPPRGYTTQDAENRREWLQKRTGFTLETPIPKGYDDTRGIIENYIGTLAIPMAIAGPLKIKGNYANDEYYVPLCTLEGTLSLSMTRGLYITALSGGIETRHVKQELSRSPIFTFTDIHQSGIFSQWVKEHFTAVKEAAESTTNHGKLLRIDHYTLHNRLILDFVYYTAEAAGQNMVTIATKAACDFINQHLGQTLDYHYLIECNFNGDKKPAFKNFIHGRGHTVIASTLIKDRYLKRLLRCSAEDFMRVFAGEFNIGTNFAGASGMHLHVANALTAIYLATGQDAACVAENALGVLDFTLENGDLRMNLTMPSITVGTVGGGTRLKQQQENLKLLGCVGDNSAKKLAEIVCACCLALELSLSGAIISDEFTAAHSQYGRK